jgi:galactosyl transferase GMA12/MNN10 family
VSRALVTFALGEHGRLLELSLPRFAEYADRHGYELHVRPPRLVIRPPSWLKVAALLDALNHHEEALWIDADVVIVDGELDLADEVPEHDLQALVRHRTPDGEVPNAGVWFVRQAMRPVLVRIWRMDRYLDHPWWEQAALLDLLGYRHRRRPVELAEPTELYRRTHWLGLEWNSHEQNDRHPSPRFAHATCGSVDWREQVMRDYLARARELAHDEGGIRWASTF